MQRIFTVTLPADTNFHNLYAALLLVTGATPTDGILPDRGCGCQLTADAGNAGTVKLGDGNFANTSGPLIAAGGTILNRSELGNTICFREYYLAGSAASQKFQAVLEFR
jgi:hypothetical protein